MWTRGGSTNRGHRIPVCNSCGFQTVATLGGEGIREDALEGPTAWWRAARGRMRHRDTRAISPPTIRDPTSNVRGSPSRALGRAKPTSPSANGDVHRHAPCRPMKTSAARSVERSRALPASSSLRLTEKRRVHPRRGRLVRVRHALRMLVERRRRGPHVTPPLDAVELEPGQNAALVEGGGAPHHVRDERLDQRLGPGLRELILQQVLELVVAIQDLHGMGRGEHWGHGTR